MRTYVYLLKLLRLYVICFSTAITHSSRIFHLHHSLDGHVQVGSGTCGSSCGSRGFRKGGLRLLAVKRVPVIPIKSVMSITWAVSLYFCGTPGDTAILQKTAIARLRLFTLFRYSAIPARTTHYPSVRPITGLYCGDLSGEGS